MSGSEAIGGGAAGAKGGSREPDGPGSGASDAGSSEGSALGRLAARLGRGLAVLLGLLLLAGAAGLFTLTQTRVGRDAVAGWIEGRLEAAFSGDVQLGPIVAGNLISHATLGRFAIVEPGGETFVSLDSVRIAYDPTGFLRGNFIFREVRAAGGRLQLLQARDGTWNFDRIFTADTAAPPGETRLSLHDVEIGSGEVTMRMPWASDLEGAAYESAVAEGLRGDALWRVEPAPEGEGYVQVVELESLSGGFPLMRLAHPRLPMEIRMEELAAVLKAVQLPLDVLHFDGRLTFGDSVRVEVDDARLPASRLFGGGWVLPSDPVAYRFEIEADPAGFSDLQWLPVPVPEEGGGPMDLVLWTRGEVPVVEVLGGSAEVRDSEMEGSFTLLLEETPRFEALDLRFRPLRLQLVDRLLERDPLIDGYVDGRVRGTGPIDRLRIDAEGTLRDLEGGEPPSRLRAVGGVSLVEPYLMRDLRLELQAFEARWARVVGVELDLGGRLRGDLTLDGVTGERLAFTADLYHESPEHATSHVSGGGTTDFGEPSRVDVQLTADPLALALLDPHFPDLRLVGTVRGPLSARGTLADLRAEANLETPRGRLTFDGRFDLEAERKAYDALVEARGVDLRQWAEAFPETQLAIRGSVRGRGTDPATLEARLDLEILPSVFAEARIDTSLVRLRVADGLAVVDTFAVRTDVGEARGRGGLGVAEELSGTLVLDLEVQDLSRWNRWLVAGRSGAGTPERPEDLFANFPGETEPAERAGDETRPDTLAGSLAARGVVFGNVDAFSFGGSLSARGLSYGEYGADSLAARLDVARPRELDSLVMNATAWNLRALGQRVDSLSTRLERIGPGRADVRLFAVRDTALLLDVAGDARWDEASRRVALERLRLRLGQQDLRLAGPATLAYGDSGLVARDFVLRGEGGGLLSARGEVPAEGEANFDLEFRDLRVEELLEPRPDAPDLTGLLDGSLAVRGTSRRPVMRASFRIDSAGIAAVTYPRLDSEFEYEDRRLVGELDLRGEAGLLARASGEVEVDLAFRDAREPRLPDDAFDFRIRADSLPAQVIELMAENLRDVTGFVRGEMRVTGGPERVELDGEVRLLGGEASAPDLGVRFLEVAGGARFRGTEAHLDSLHIASSGGGTAVVSGSVDLAELSDPAFDLRLTARRLHAVDRRAMSFLLSGEATLAGSYREPVLTGEARIFNGDVRQEEFLRSQEIIDLTDPEVFGLIDTTVVAERRLFERVQNPFMRNLRLDLDLDVGPDLWLRSAVMDVEILGEDLDVRMDRAEESLVAFGTVRLVRGTYVFQPVPQYRQQLRITGGTIEFVGEPGLNPNLQITAEYRTRTEQGTVTIRVGIGGTMRQTEISLTSDPPMAESDQLCFLALGSPCAAAADVANAQRIWRDVALGTIGTGLSGALVGDMGLDFFALRSARSTAVADADGFFSATELEVGKYLGSDLFVTVTQPLGSRYPGWSIEWRFSPNWTLEARAENRFARRFGLATGSSLEFDQTFGLFLFREWSF